MKRFLPVLVAALLGAAFSPAADLFRTDPGFRPRFERVGGVVYAIHVLPDGTIYAAGTFSGAGPAAGDNIVKILPDGTPDPTFHPVTTDEGRVHALATQADGKLLVGGDFEIVAGSGRKMFIRLNTDGTLDETFGSEQSASSAVTSIVVQPDGRILVAGEFSQFAGQNRPTLVRLLADGTLDPDFATTLISTYSFYTSLALQTDGRILLGGYLQFEGGSTRSLVRLNADGSEDTTFQVPAYPGQNGSIRTILLQPDGKILLGGSFWNETQTLHKGLYRLNVDGSIDSSFLPGADIDDPEVVALARFPDGRIAAAGIFHTVMGETRDRIVVLQADGTVDPSFVPAEDNDNPEAMKVLPDGKLLWGGGGFLTRLNGDGTVDETFPHSVRRPANVSAVLRLADGKWMVGGDFTYANARPRGSIARLLADGTLDPSFVVGTGFIGSVGGLARGPEGDVYVQGNISSYQGEPATNCVRLNDDGSRDAEFAIPPTSTVLLFNPTVDANGRLWMALQDAGGGFTGMKVVRLLANGQLDPAFASPTIFNGYLTHLLPQTDGSVIVTGNFGPFTGMSIPGGIARLLADGTRDTTFPAGTGFDAIVKSAIQLSDGSLVVAGDFSSFDESPAPGLARVTQAGALDPAFVPPSFSTRVNYDLARRSDDRFWALGWYSLDDQKYNSLLRFTPAGAVDLAPEIYREDRYPSLFELALASDDRPAVAGDWDNDALFPAPGGFVLLEPAPVPVITAPPVSQIAAIGATVSFTVVASGDAATYQWYHDGSPIDGATGATLALTNVQLADAGSYVVVLTNLWGSTTSTPVTLSGPNPVPTIVSAPSSIVAVAGQAAALSVQASGAGALSYQWRKFGAPISGATGSSLSFGSAEFADAGFYDVLVGDGMSVARAASVEIRVKPPFYPNLLRPRSSFAPLFETQGGSIFALLPLSDGRFYAGGSFSRASGELRINLARFEADGSVDTSFVPPGLLGSRVQALARQSDGKLLAAGYLRVQGNASITDIVRLNVDGSLDSTFALGGELNGEIETVAVQADGKILIGGGFTLVGSEPRGRIARLLSDGTLDPTFTTGSGFNAQVRAIGVQSDGRILVLGGFGSYNGGSVGSYGLVRLESDGSYDASFALVTNPFAAPGCVAVLADDSLIVGLGYGTAGSPMVVHADPNGVVDTVFTPTSPGGTVSVDHLAVQPDGKVVASIFTYAANYGLRGEVVRFNSDGTTDETFVGGATNEATQVFAIAVTAGGEALVGGNFWRFADGDARGLIRLDGDGQLVSGFTADLVSRGSVLAVAPASGGGWWVGGGFNRVNGTTTSGLVRLTAEGTLDPSFSPDPDYRVAVYDLVELGDGRVVAAGMFGGSGVSSEWGLARFETDGTRDTSYEPADFAGAFSTEVALLPDGSAVASGSILDNSSAPRILARVRPDGTVDHGYGAQMTFANAPQVIETMADGRAYVGEATLSTPGHFQVGLARLLADGSVDESFVATGLPDSNVSAVAPRPDGSLWVGGSFSNGFQPLEYRNVVRLLGSGARDEGFTLVESFSSAIRDIVAQDDGSVLVAGSLTPWPDIPLTDTLARFRSDGSRAQGPVVMGSGLRDPIAATRPTAEGGLLVAGTLEFDDFVSGGLALLEPVPEPLIQQEPEAPAPTTAGGSGVTLHVDALTNGDTTYQWQVQYAGGGSGAARTLRAPSLGDDGFVDVPGASGPTLSIPVPQRFHNGAYRVVITANGHSVTSAPVTVEVAAATPSADARLLNLSTRALVQTGDNVLIPGFVVAGTGSKKVLIRAVGPTLGEPPFNIPGVLSDPRILVKKHNFATGLDDDVEANDNWSSNANFVALKQTMADLYAFSIPDDSNDAALLLDLTPGQYTVVTDGVASGTGIAIVELYDADSSGATARLVNISNRGFVGTGDNVMIPGFVVSSEGPKTMLIRAVGPTLAGAPFNVGGTMADPKLTVFQTNQAKGTSTEILTQDNWGENPDAVYTAQTAHDVSAFALDTGSADAAFVVTLPPGVYTVIGSAADGTSTGVVLVEIYVVE